MKVRETLKKLWAVKAGKAAVTGLILSCGAALAIPLLFKTSSVAGNVITVICVFCAFKYTNQFSALYIKIATEKNRK